MVESKNLIKKVENESDEILSSFNEMIEVKNSLRKEIELIEQVENKINGIDEILNRGKSELKKISVEEFEKLQNFKKDLDSYIKEIESKKIKLTSDLREKIEEEKKILVEIFEDIETEKIKIDDSYKKVIISNSVIKKVLGLGFVGFVGLGIYTSIVIENQKENLEKIDLNNYTKNETIEQLTEELNTKFKQDYESLESERISQDLKIEKLLKDIEILKSEVKESETIKKDVATGASFGEIMRNEVNKKSDVNSVKYKQIEEVREEKILNYDETILSVIKSVYSKKNHNRDIAKLFINDRLKEKGIRLGNYELNNYIDVYMNEREDY